MLPIRDMKIAILIHSGPETGKTRLAGRIASEAQARGHEVTVFAMAAGVQVLADEGLARLVEDGVNITVCEMNRKEYRSPENIEGVKYGSQYDLATYANEYDRLISFT